MIGKALTVISSRTDNCSHQNNTLLFGCELDCSRHMLSNFNYFLAEWRQFEGSVNFNAIKR